ncbi:MAG: FtsH protease activity modulator HflK [Gammaproteobacteria bacterium]|nr:FtsH protease activity modulator HflK [Gammaproteobacteria bacterium]
MAWNEPGGSGNKDPWGNSGGGKNQGPPDLDEVLKKFQNKLGGIFGGKSTGGGDSGSGAPGSGAIGLILVVVVIVWGLSGIYIVEPAERGVVTRFGQYVDTSQPGPHWHIPYPVESVEIVDVDQNRNVEVGYRQSSAREAASVPQEALMLTQDENIVDIKFAVQYRVKDAKDYLFMVRDPDATLRQATESAIREAVGKSKMDFVLTEGQSDIADRTEQLIQEQLDRYGTGLEVIGVNLQSAQPPQEVRGAFEDAIKAREDQQRLINEAEAYSNDTIPRARGKAARELEQASGYKARIVAQAEGESQRFEQMLTEYKKAPKVTRQRLYLETMESVLSSTTKVMIDVKGGNNLMYLPLDRLMPQGASSPTAVPMNLPEITEEGIRRVLPESRNRDNSRGRGGR